jgi:hypothetical protein
VAEGREKGDRTGRSTGGARVGMRGLWSHAQATSFSCGGMRKSRRNVATAESNLACLRDAIRARHHPRHHTPSYTIITHHHHAPCWRPWARGCWWPPSSPPAQQEREGGVRAVPTASRLTPPRCPFSDLAADIAANVLGGIKRGCHQGPPRTTEREREIQRHEAWPVRSVFGA